MKFVEEGSKVNEENFTAVKFSLCEPSRYDADFSLEKNWNVVEIFFRVEKLSNICSAITEPKARLFIDKRDETNYILLYNSKNSKVFKENTVSIDKMSDTKSCASMNSIAYNALEIIAGEGAKFKPYHGNMYDNIARLGLPHISQHLLEKTMDSEHSRIFTIDKPIESDSGLVMTAFGGSVVDLIYAYRRETGLLITTEACRRLAVELYDLSQKPVTEHRLYSPFVQAGELVTGEPSTTTPEESVEELAQAIHALLKVE